jgi:hypothetical protein
VKNKEEPITGPIARAVDVYKGAAYGKASDIHFELHFKCPFQYNVSTIDYKTAQSIFNELAEEFSPGINTTNIQEIVQQSTTKKRLINFNLNWKLILGISIGSLFTLGMITEAIFKIVIMIKLLHRL